MGDDRAGVPLAPETVSLSYEDAAQVAEYAAPYVSEFTAKGYITDSANGRFRPTEPITRAEIVNILGNMVNTLVKDTVEWTGTARGSLLVSSTEGAVLNRAEIDGDLLVAPGVSGKVTLIDCTVYGEIRNFGTAEVVFESGTAEPDTPTEPEKPGHSAPRRSIRPAHCWAAPLPMAEKKCRFTVTGL